MGPISHHVQRSWALYSTTLLILVIGLATSAAFLAVGISSALDERNAHFERSALDLINKISDSWEDYLYAALLIHNRCRDRNFTRSQFRDLYEYLIADGLQFQAAQFDPNITHAEREAAEQEAREYYAQYYKHIDYQGFVGFNMGNETSPQPRWEAPFYLPIHYMEPIIGNERAIDLDYHASGSRRKTVLFCLDQGTPGLTDRLRLVQETEEASYGMVLFHPGINLTSQNDVWPRDLASIVVRIPDLIARGANNRGESSQAYLYDLHDSKGSPLFLGGTQIDHVRGGEPTLNQMPEIELEELLAASDRYLLKEITVANKQLAAVVVALPDTFHANTLFVVLGGCTILVASVLLAAWVWTNTRRVARETAERARSEAEKTALILDNAQQAAKAERELVSSTRSLSFMYSHFWFHSCSIMTRPTHC
jgi:CHASE1-domain containing sensor protein